MCARYSLETTNWTAPQIPDVNPERKEDKSDQWVRFNLLFIYFTRLKEY